MSGGDEPWSDTVLDDVGRRLLCLGTWVVVATGLTACAARQPTSLTDAFVTAGEPQIVIGDPIDASTGLLDPTVSPPPLDEVEMHRPAPLAPAATRLEDRIPELTTALAQVVAHPSPAAHRLVAALYRQHEVLDLAYDHLRDAERLDSRDPATQQALAQLWTAWGFPQLGLGAAYRAVALAPTAAPVHGTLGVVLQRVGHVEAARQAFERALTLDPSAAYAHNNLCVLARLERAFEAAIESCQAAIALEPSRLTPRHNLALVYLATGRGELAVDVLQGAGVAWTAQYNLGLAHLARGDDAAAATAFEAASRARPDRVKPRRMVVEARQRMMTRPLPADGAGAGEGETR